VPPEPDTPCLLVDVDRLDANITRMAGLAATRQVALRPHAKTHKSPAVAARQLAAGGRGLTVATVSEAEVFAAAGFDDLFLAYPLWVTPALGRRLCALLDIVTLTIGVDSPDSARALAAQVATQLPADHRDRLRVLVEVDSGQHRSGVQPAAAGELAEQVGHAGLDVRGVFTFPGHSYAPDGRQRAADDEADALARAAAALADRGLTAVVVSGGSTPSAGLTPTTEPDAADTGARMTELRPGVYVFGDAQQWELGTMPPEQIALTCLGTVVSHAGGRLVLDSGSKALGADRAAWATGHGRLLDHPEARITGLSEHHAVVEWPDGQPRPELGARVRVVPNHVCNAVNLADRLLVVANGRIVDSWPVAARGANT
jgi:D-serine deaminase-like pyridoxal phosphate-dependent protein